jgi:tetratricopeptide (TPR) repeat protein
MTVNPRIVELRRRLEKDPASIAFAQLAEEYRRGGDQEQAATICRDGLARHPGYLSAQVTLGRALMELGRYDEARRELEAVLKVAPDNLAAIRALAVIHQFRRHTPAPVDDQPQVNIEMEETPAAPESEVMVAPEVTSAVVAPAEREPVTAPVVPPSDPVADIFEEPIELPTVSDAGQWMLDVDIELDLPEPEILDVPPTLLQQPDPALEQLEAWLAAIVADRQHPG